MDVSLVIPAHNERDNIPTLVDACREAVSGFEGSHEIIVIDDGSTDGSGELLREIGEGEPMLRVIAHAPGENIGCHPSEIVGLKAATGDVMVFLPADLQIHPNVTPAFVEAAGRADIVASHRVNRADNAMRRFISAVNNRVERMVIGVDVNDAHSSMAFTRRAVDELIPSVVSQSALIPAEILLRAHRKGISVTEIEIEHFPRVAGRQTGATLSEIAGVQLDLLRLRRTVAREG
ncbi:MAG TPA: glycosyltransferase family 2 protein [Thermoleophilaceae bacterium]|nr:glycosyltransferase family 2 protein [Thermoleophilaceae bacterium]